MKKIKVITLCGSTKFKEIFDSVNWTLTMAGNVVFSCGVFAHAGGDILSEDEKKLLDDIHKQKIDMSDEILVINKNGYIGSSTQNEIHYAIAKGKIVKYLEGQEMKHYLKISPSHFKAVKDGTKPFELRKDDRSYNVGDILVLQEYAYGLFTGEELEMIISFILRGGPWLSKGYCALGLLEG